MNFSAWWSGAYGDVPYGSDDEERTVECASCGADLPASWDGEEYVADEACECEDEEIDGEAPISPIASLCDDIARDIIKNAGGGMVPLPDDTKPKGNLT